MNEGRFLVKHAVGGRTFIDTGVERVPFTLEEKDGVWIFTVNIAQGETLSEILKWRDELNVFIFEEDRQPVRKNWFYVGSVSYDDARQTLAMTASSRLPYIPDEYTW